jgi:outer membrane protein TolC
MLFTKVYAAEAPVWTLDAAVRQALSVAPEIREAAAEIAAREGTLKQAGAWPNPSIDLRADQKLGSRMAAAAPTSRRSRYRSRCRSRVSATSATRPRRNWRRRANACAWRALRARPKRRVRSMPCNSPRDV